MVAWLCKPPKVAQLPLHAVQVLHNFVGGLQADVGMLKYLYVWIPSASLLVSFQMLLGNPGFWGDRELACVGYFAGAAGRSLCA